MLVAAFGFVDGCPYCKLGYLGRQFRQLDFEFLAEALIVVPAAMTGFFFLVFFLFSVGHAAAPGAVVALMPHRTVFALERSVGILDQRAFAVTRASDEGV